MQMSPAAASVPVPPPGFTERVTASPTVHHGSMRPGEVRSLEGGAPVQAALPSRPAMPVTGTTEQMTANMGALLDKPVLDEEQYQGVKDWIATQAGTTGTHYRNLARFAGLPVDEPTPEDQAAYKQAVIDGIIASAGGVAGKWLGAKVGDAVKFVGRGVRSPMETGEFVNRMAPFADGGEKAGIRAILDPVISGAVAAQAIDAINPHDWVGGGGEFADSVVGAAGGVGTAALVARSTINDLLVKNPEYRRLMLSPSRGTAGSLIGVMIGLGANEGIKWTAKNTGQIVDYVSKLFDNGQLPADAPTAPPDSEIEGKR